MKGSEVRSSKFKPSGNLSLGCRRVAGTWLSLRKNGGWESEGHQEPTHSFSYNKYLLGIYPDCRCWSYSRRMKQTRYVPFSS